MARCPRCKGTGVFKAHRCRKRQCELCAGTGIHNATSEHFRDATERALKTGGKVTITKDWADLEYAEPPIREDEAIAMGLTLLSAKWEGDDDFSKGMRLLQKRIAAKGKKMVETESGSLGKRNRARCKKCGDIIESLHRHDFKWCKCKSIAVDGGKDYHRRVGEPANIEEMP